MSRRAAFSVLLSYAARATFEGVAFAVRHIRDTFVSQGNIIHQLSLTGGGARSSVLPAIIASVLDTEFRLVDPDASCRGAAMIAAAGLQLYPTIEAASQAMIRSEPSVVPNLMWVATYNSVYNRYRAIVDA